MRNQCFIATLLFFLMSLSLYAERRSESEARRIAEQYIDLPSKASSKKYVPAQGDSTATPLYVYNSEQGGFVVVSGSDRLPAVIGYSDSGTLDLDDPSMPDNLRYWLDYAAYAAEVVEVTPEASTLGEKYYGKDYAPLLGKINFNQDFPYNKQCPEGTFTGCMATAMSQVMAYWKYPAQGNGWGSVRYNGTTYSADLSTPAFDWENILPAYKGVNATESQQDAVAQLHYYVGLALELHYGEDGTAGVSTKYATALRENFGYNKNVCIVNRDCFTYGEWVDLLLNEFEHGRPVLYDGASGSGGHAFVIDGYRAADGWFHVNWGWGEHSNGYFNITLLNPTSTGIGASLSSGFVTQQDAVINITPEQETGTYYAPIYSYANGGITSSSVGEVIPAGYPANVDVAYMANFSDKAFYGTYGVIIMQDDTEVERIQVGTVSGKASTYDVNNEVTFYGNSWTVPAMPDGDYRVYVYVEQNGYPASILHTHTSRPNFFCMYMRDGSATFSMGETYPTELEMSPWNFEQKEMNISDNQISVDITNKGTGVENGTFSIQFDAPHRLTQVIKTKQIRILPGETHTLTFWTDMLDYGTYTVRGLYMDRENGCGKTIISEGEASFNIYRDVETTRSMLTTRLAELQNIINTASYGNEEGEYPVSARDKMQEVLNAFQQKDFDNMEVAELQSLYDELSAAADEFFRSMNVVVVTNKWSYAGDATVDTGWSLGVLEQPAYFGISVSAAELQPYRGGKIVGISALFGRRTSYQSPQPEDLTTQVLLLDYNGHPGERVLASSDNVHPTTQEYDDYYFNEPYVIGDNGVLAVCKVTMHKNFYAAMGACSKVVREGACWMNNGNGWSDMYKSYGSGAAGHAIKLIIQGGETNVVDAVLENVTAEPVMVNDDITISGEIKNACHKVVNKVVMQWTMDDGTLGNSTIERAIEPEGREKFEIALPGFSKAKLHTIQLRVLTVDGMNDMVESNSNVRVSVPITETNYERALVVEDHVSSECPYSPRSISTFNMMKEEYGDRFIGISVHTDRDNPDPMSFPDSGYSHLTNLCPTTPSGLVNRKSTLYTNLEPNSLRTMLDKESQLGVARVTAEASYSPTMKKITVKAATEFGYDFNNGDYRYCFVIVEDQVGPYSQKGMSGTILHDNVAREIVPEYKGLANALPTSAVSGHKYEYTCRFSMPDNVETTGNVRIVCLLLDGSNGAVLNAVSAPVGIDDSTDTPVVDDLDGDDDDTPGPDDGDDDDDDDDYDYDDDGLPIIKVKLPDGVELDNTVDMLPTDLLYYIRYYENDQWQPLYVPFDMEYKKWQRHYEIAEWKEAKQYDEDGDGVAEITVLRFEPLGEGSSVTHNTPYLIRAKETGEQTITLSKAIIKVADRKDITASTEYGNISIKGTYDNLTDLRAKGYYIMKENNKMELPENSSEELSSMRWYLTLKDKAGNAYPQNEVFITFDDEDPLAIRQINARNNTDTMLMYDLQGRRLQDKTHGIYIQGGKKYKK